MSEAKAPKPKDPKEKLSAANSGKLLGKERPRHFPLPWWGWVLLLATAAGLVTGAFLLFVFKVSLTDAFLA
jgi:hypothetical protein